jgi:endonuclease/exonuclease/phosphatase family metal-dependent hydrolase
MSCINSSRAGRSSSKEQYGVMYKDSIQITNLRDFAENESYYEVFERPPLRFTATRNNISYTFYTIHIKPDDAQNEISWLDYLINDLEPEFQNIIALGDFNADCSYYDETTPDFKGWTRVITNSDDTTQGQKDCAYDRVLMRDPSILSNKYGIYTQNLTKKHSDHYPLWFEIVQ